MEGDERDPKLPLVPFQLSEVSPCSPDRSRSMICLMEHILLRSAYQSCHLAELPEQEDVVAVRDKSRLDDCIKGT